MRAFVIHDAFVSMAGIVLATADTVPDLTNKEIVVDGERIAIIGYDFTKSILDQKNHFLLADSVQQNLDSYVGKLASIVAV